MPLIPGTRLGPYEILAAIGAGGMGEVYRARDTRLGRDVAVKILSTHLSFDPDLKRRFEREAVQIPVRKSMAALDKDGGYHYPASQTPWQEIQRAMVDQLAEGMVLKPVVKYRRVAQVSGIPRNSH